MVEWSAHQTCNVAVQGLSSPALARPLTGFVLGCYELKYSAMPVNCQLVASYQLGFLVLWCCMCIICFRYYYLFLLFHSKHFSISVWLKFPTTADQIYKTITDISVIDVSCTDISRIKDSRRLVAHLFWPSVDHRIWLLYNMKNYIDLKGCYPWIILYIILSLIQ